MHANRFFHHPFRSVPPDSASGMLRHNEPNPQGNLPGIPNNPMIPEQLAGPTATLRKYTFEGTVAAEDFSLLHFGDPVIREAAGLPLVADRQFLPPPCAPLCEYLTPGLGGHSCTESVRVSALSLVRLKGTFHAELPITVS